MDKTFIIQLITIIITWGLGVVSKRNKFINNNLIPIQNILIGLSIAIIEFIITKDFELAIATSGFIAGGSYDLLHNLNKIINKGDN